VPKQRPMRKETCSRVIRVGVAVAHMYLFTDEHPVYLIYVFFTSYLINCY
jgi:hypothetical protein